jgi:hypothetical protein
MRWQLLLVGTVMIIVGAAQAFIAPKRPVVPTRQCNWIGDLWTEVIEFSTYGPGERKLLKVRVRVRVSLYSSKTPCRSHATMQLDRRFVDRSY